MSLCSVSEESAASEEPGASWCCVAEDGEVGDVETEMCVCGVGGSLSAAEHADNTENATAVGINAACNLIDTRLL